MFTFASRALVDLEHARVDAAQRVVGRGEPALELGQVGLRVGAGERPRLRDGDRLAELPQQLRRDERAVDGQEDRGLGGRRAEAGEHARDRRPRLERLDDDRERQLEVPLPDRESRRRTPRRAAARHAPRASRREARERLRRAKARSTRPRAERTPVRARPLTEGSGLASRQIDMSDRDLSRTHGFKT